AESTTPAGSSLKPSISNSSSSSHRPSSLVAKNACQKLEAEPTPLKGQTRRSRPRKCGRPRLFQSRQLDLDRRFRKRRKKTKETPASPRERPRHFRWRISSWSTTTKRQKGKARSGARRGLLSLIRSA